MTQRPKGPEHGRHADPPRQTGAAKAGPWDDWVTIWQSELNALVTDREVAGVFRRVVGLWADGARAAGAWLPDGAAGRAGAEPPSRATPAAAALDARDLALERLARRVEELERRLAGLDGHEPEP